VKQLINFVLQNQLRFGE